MNRKTKILYTIIEIVVPIALVFLNLILVRKSYSYNFAKVLIFSLLSVIFFFLLNILLHEAGHLLFGKTNNFEKLSFTFFCIKKDYFKKRNKTYFVPLDEAWASVEMVNKSSNEVIKRLKKYTFGGVFFNIILSLLGCVVFFVAKKVSENLFIFISFCLPVSIYNLLNNLLPKEFYGARNDGGILYGLKRLDDTSKVIINLHKIEAELYQGKTPKDISKDLYFNLPQIQEDSPYFISLLSARLYYFIDVKDYDNAIKTLNRLDDLSVNLPKPLFNQIQIYKLLAVCSFNKNENLADEIVEDNQKYLNNHNTAFNLLAKTYYLSLNSPDKDTLDMFINKTIKEAKNLKILGLERFYIYLIDELNY